MTSEVAAHQTVTGVVNSVTDLGSRSVIVRGVNIQGVVTSKAVYTVPVVKRVAIQGLVKIQ